MAQEEKKEEAAPAAAEAPPLRRNLLPPHLPLSPPPSAPAAPRLICRSVRHGFDLVAACECGVGVLHDAGPRAVLRRHGTGEEPAEHVQLRDGLRPAGGHEWVAYGYSMAFAVPSAIAVDAGKNDDGSEKPKLSYLGWDPAFVMMKSFSEVTRSTVPIATARS